MPLTGEYEPGTADWARKQVDTFEATNGQEANLLRGRPIIVLPSTAKGGAISRIVPILAPGAGVVTSRGDVHHVVTEYGKVDLFGLGVHERAKALISIAHPDFREELDRQAHELRLTWRDRID